MTNQSEQRSRLTRCIVIAMAFVWLYAGTAVAAGDAVTYWNNVVVSATIAGSRSNPETGIAAAYMHIAIYNAIAAIDGRYTQFLAPIPDAPHTQRAARRIVL